MNRFAYNYSALLCALKLLMLALLMFIPVSGNHAHAGNNIMVGNTTVFEKGELAKVSLELSAATTYRVFSLENPARLVIDVDAYGKSANALGNTAGSAIIKSIRYGVYKPGVIRIVLDSNYSVIIGESRVTTKAGNAILDVAFKAQGLNSTNSLAANTTNTNATGSIPGSITGQPLTQPKLSAPKVQPTFTAPEKTPKAPPAPSSTSTSTSTKPIVSTQPSTTPIASHSKPVVVIDAGHGGVDPGAIGKGGTKEKHVTLKYANLLKAALERTGRYTVRMTRSDDSFVKLQDRVARARGYGADLFMSLHADTAPEDFIQGLSIYTLSEQASDDLAARLADQENSVDSLGGFKINSDNPEVKGILVDLARRETKSKSAEFADTLVAELGKRVKLLRNTHRQAGFVVLKSPDVPAVLVEIGFLSNENDEKLLNNPAFSQKVVEGLRISLDNYFRNNPIR
jgi:N-acetylmuramoyl-L-alanine amidase